MADDIKTYKNIRFSNRIDTESKWKSAAAILADGEIGFVRDKGYFIVGDGKTNSYAIISNPDSYSKNIYYTGAAEGGGGGGSSYTLPVATQSVLGGVRSTDKRGIVIDSDGYISSDLVSYYNNAKECYEVNKLYIHQLEYDNKETTSEFDGSNLILRASSTAPLLYGEYSGITVNKLTNNINGFLGLSANNYITIMSQDGGYTEVVGIYPYTAPGEVARGIVSIAEGNNYANIASSSALVIVGQGDTQAYRPENEEDIRIDLTPATITINGQVIKPFENNYFITLDGGLTPENAEKLDNLDKQIERIDFLEQNSLSSATTVPDTVLKTTIGDPTPNGRNIEIEHLGNKPETDSESQYIYPIKNTSDPEVITVIVGIECDDTGHVTKIITRDLGWKIQSITPAT
jgi:hypothetical protein